MKNKIMEKNDIKTAINLANIGKYNEAKELMKLGVTEKEFLNNISVKDFNPSLFNFVKAFNDTDWHIYAKNMNYKNSIEFVHLAKQSSVDLLNQDKNGKTVIDILLTNKERFEQVLILESLDSSILTKVFLGNDTYKKFAEWTNLTLSSQMESTINLFKKITNLNTLNSGNRHKLFTEDNYFTYSFIKMHYVPFDETKKLFTECADFFQPYTKKLLDSKLVFKLLSGYQLDQSDINGFKDAIKNKSLEIDFEVLKDSREYILNGNLRLEYNSDQYKVFKELLANGLIPLENLNNPIQSKESNLTRIPVFERFLVQNFKSNHYNSEHLDMASQVIKEVNELTKLGIEQKCVSHTSDEVIAFFKPSRIKFINKEYVPLNEDETKKADEIEQAWRDLVSRTIFVNNKSNNKFNI